MLIDDNIRNIFDSLYDGILIIDKNGIVKYINPSYTRITKISKDEILDKKLLNEAFINKAPEKLVREEMDKKEQARDKLVKLQEKLDNLKK